jgi:subtilase family serine protease
LEALETRTLLSAGGATAVASSQPTAAPSGAQIRVDPFSSYQPAAAPSAAVSPLAANGRAPYSPAQIASAYGFSQITFTKANGQTIKGDGSGQTIAIVDAYDDPNIANDLHVFDRQFGLADPNLTVVAPQGRPATDSGWAVETSLDVEWAHAVAPGANILLVEARSSSLSDLLAAVDYARSYSGVSVVSMSWGAGEFQGETTQDSHFTTPANHGNVSFVASSGDNGAGASWPSISSRVLSVGGTSLNLTTGNAWSSETAWSGSGGGVSRYVSEPTWQQGVQSSGKRENPDVAYDANPNTGFYVYDSVPDGGYSGWYAVGGTSAGAPQWAALVAIADQGRALVGQAALANVQSLVYSLPSSDFHDIKSGSTGYSATTGYDLATGLGTPVANKVVADLVKGVSPASSSTTTGSWPFSGPFRHSTTLDIPWQSGPSEAARAGGVWLATGGLFPATSAPTRVSQAGPGKAVPQGFDSTLLRTTSPTTPEPGVSAANAVASLEGPERRWVDESVLGYQPGASVNGAPAPSGRGAEGEPDAFDEVQADEGQDTL